MKLADSSVPIGRESIGHLTTAAATERMMSHIILSGAKDLKMQSVAFLCDLCVSVARSHGDSSRPQLDQRDLRRQPQSPWQQPVSRAGVDVELRRAATIESHVVGEKCS